MPCGYCRGVWPDGLTVCAMTYYVLVGLALLLALAGVVGAIVPALPGPPIGFLALLIVYFVCPGEVSTTVLLAALALTAVVTVLDYVVPIWVTKMGGGSRQAVWGSTLGMLVGLFFMPAGLLVGPLIGAFVGELMDHSHTGKAVRVALLSFVGFILTTGLKFVLCVAMAQWVVAAIW